MNTLEEKITITKRRQQNYHNNNQQQQQYQKQPLLSSSQKQQQQQQLTTSATIRNNTKKSLKVCRRRSIQSLRHMFRIGFCLLICILILIQYHLLNNSNNNYDDNNKNNNKNSILLSSSSSLASSSITLQSQQQQQQSSNNKNNDNYFKNNNNNNNNNEAQQQQKDDIIDIIEYDSTTIHPLCNKIFNSNSNSNNNNNIKIGMTTSSIWEYYKSTIYKASIPTFDLNFDGDYDDEENENDDEENFNEVLIDKTTNYKESIKELKLRRKHKHDLWIYKLLYSPLLSSLGGGEGEGGNNFNYGISNSIKVIPNYNSILKLFTKIYLRILNPMKYPPIKIIVLGGSITEGIGCTTINNNKLDILIQKQKQLYFHNYYNQTKRDRTGGTTSKKFKPENGGNMNHKNGRRTNNNKKKNRKTMKSSLRECSWPNKLQFVLENLFQFSFDNNNNNNNNNNNDNDNDNNKNLYNIFTIENLSVGGTNTDASKPFLLYWLSNKLKPIGGDIIINSYSANDNLPPAFHNTKNTTKDLFHSIRIYHRILNFLKISLYDHKKKNNNNNNNSNNNNNNQNQKNCNTNNKNIKDDDDQKNSIMYDDNNNDSPLVFFINDYIGNQQESIIGDTTLDDMITNILLEYYDSSSSSLSSSNFYGIGYISPANIIKRYIYGNIKENILSPKWYAGKKNEYKVDVHYNMPGHFIVMWSILYNMLHITTTFCEENYFHSKKNFQLLQNNNNNNQNNNQNNNNNNQFQQVLQELRNKQQQQQEDQQQSSFSSTKTTTTTSNNIKNNQNGNNENINHSKKISSLGASLLQLEQQQQPFKYPSLDQNLTELSLKKFMLEQQEEQKQQKSTTMSSSSSSSSCLDQDTSIATTTTTLDNNHNNITTTKIIIRNWRLKSNHQQQQQQRRQQQDNNDDDDDDDDDVTASRSRKQKQKQQQQQQAAIIKDQSPCIFAFLAAPLGTHQDAHKLQHFINKFKFIPNNNNFNFNNNYNTDIGWQAKNDFRHGGFQNKLGLVAMNTNSTISLQFPNIQKVVRVLTIHYLKSYGPKWDFSLMKGTLEIYNNNNNNNNNNNTNIIQKQQQQQQQPMQQQKQQLISRKEFQLEGYHNQTTSISYHYQLDLKDDVAPIGSSILLHLNLINGETFKINAMMLCDR